MKLGKPGEKIGEIWGIPIIVSAVVPERTVIVAALPTLEQIIADGCSSLQEWVKKHPKSFAVIKDVEISEH